MFASSSLQPFITMQQKRDARLDTLEEKADEKVDADEIRRTAEAKTWETGLTRTFCL